MAGSVDFHHRSNEAADSNFLERDNITALKPYMVAIYGFLF